MCTSGVGTQSRFLIHGLVSTGRYSFRCLGGAIKHPNYDPIVVNPDFIIKPVDGFGDRNMIRNLLINERPDAVLLFTDPRQFMWLWEMEDEVHQVCPIAYWHVWDNDPYPAFNDVWYKSTDLINCLSHKTYDLVKPHFPEKTNYIPHAFPKEVYYPLPADTVKQLRLVNYKDRADWFIGAWVNRNATRKMPNDVLMSWKMFLDELERKEGHRKAMLVMHTDPQDTEGPNLFATVENLGLAGNVVFSTQKVDFNDMNALYNSVDFVVNVSKAEGFGLATLSALMVGKPIIALKTGGMTRQVVDYRDGSEHGVAIDPACRVLVGSQMVPYIFDDHFKHEDLTAAFHKVYSMSPEEKELLAKKNIAYAEHEFGYEQMISEWDRTLSKLITDFRNNPPKRWTCSKLNNK